MHNVETRIWLATKDLYTTEGGREGGEGGREGMMKKGLTSLNGSLILSRSTLLSCRHLR